MRYTNAIKTLAAAAFAVSLVMAAGACHERFIVIQVKKPPDIDPSVYKRIGVLPFKGEEDEGLLASKEVRDKMAEEVVFLVEPAETVDAALDRVDYFEPSSRDQALALGAELGVDAVLVGEVEFFQRTYSPEGDVRNELYTADRQTIAPFELGSSYATRYMDISSRYTLRLTVKALDVKTGRLMRRREFEATTMHSYEQSELTQAPTKEKEIFDELLGKVVDDFIYTLQPHDVAQTREVARF
jgi:hypothetical protein